MGRYNKRIEQDKVKVIEIDVEPKKEVKQKIKVRNNIEKKEMITIANRRNRILVIGDIKINPFEKIQVPRDKGLIKILKHYELLKFINLR